MKLEVLNYGNELIELVEDFFDEQPGNIVSSQSLCQNEERHGEKSIAISIFQDAKVVSAAEVRKDDDGSLSIINLATSPEYRGNNLATRLLESAVNIAFDKGCSFIKVNVHDSIEANALYNSFGFEKIDSYHIKHIT